MKRTINIGRFRFNSQKDAKAAGILALKVLSLPASWDRLPNGSLELMMPGLEKAKSEQTVAVNISYVFAPEGEFVRLANVFSGPLDEFSQRLLLSMDA